MKTYTRFLDVPSSASYLGSDNGDGTMDENLADYVEDAFEPAVFRDSEGVRHYFDLQ